MTKQDILILVLFYCIFVPLVFLSKDDYGNPMSLKYGLMAIGAMSLFIGSVVGIYIIQKQEIKQG